MLLCNRDNGSVDAIVVGRFSTGNLTTAVNDLGFAPAYTVEDGPRSQYRRCLAKILDGGPFENTSSVYSPLKDQTATFSVKFKALQKEIKNLKEDDPFPFFGMAAVWEKERGRCWRIFQPLF